MYCTVKDVQRRLPEITAEVVSDSSVRHFISEADSDLDDALRHIYTVPFTTVPTAIAHMSAEFAAYKLMRTFPDSIVGDDLERLRIDILRKIKLYADGKMQLVSEYRATNDTTAVAYTYDPEPTPKYTYKSVT